MQGKLINQFMGQKAGMNEIDKDRIAKTIERMTLGSPKYIHQQQMQQKRSLQVAQMLKKCLAFSQSQKQSMTKQWWKQIYQLKQNRSLDRYWAHFDFDMFYVACELLDKPELKDKPCAVGGMNSVLSTANYQARKYGVRAAMPTFIALELCPDLILLDSNFSKYRHFSNIFRQILSFYDSNLESNGLDEAYIDMTSHLSGKNLQQIQIFISQIRTKIFEATGLTVSCGVGANKMLAKIASQQRKPNNQFILQNNAKVIEQFMSSKKIRKIPGIGPVSEFYLKGLGIQTAKDILQNLDVLTICFSKQSTQFFISTALGFGSIQHSFTQRKSIGKSQTFKATQDYKFLQGILRGLCEQVSEELQEKGYVTINSVLSYQTNNFQKRDKTFNLNKYTDKAQQIFQIVIDFFKSIVKGKLRLLGIRCSSIMKTQDYKKQQILTFMNNPKKLRESIQEQRTNAEHIKSLMRSQNSQIGKYLCPICNLYIECKGNISLFNKHIDKCLTKQPQHSKSQQSKSAKQKIIQQSKPYQPILKQEAISKTNQKQKKSNKQKNTTSGNLLNFFKKN